MFIAPTSEPSEQTRGGEVNQNVRAFLISIPMQLKLSVPCSRVNREQKMPEHKIFMKTLFFTLSFFSCSKEIFSIETCLVIFMRNETTRFNHIIASLIAYLDCLNMKHASLILARNIFLRPVHLSGITADRINAARAYNRRRRSKRMTQQYAKRNRSVLSAKYYSAAVSEMI